MKKYLALYLSEAALDEPSVTEMFAPDIAGTDEGWHGGLAELAREVRDRGVRPRCAAGQPTTVGAGSGTAGKTTVTGYTFLQAGSMDEAVTLMRDHPHLHMPGASMQILECVSMPGM